MNELWNKCLVRLEQDLTPQQFITWIRPLHAVPVASGMVLYAPNRYVLDQVQSKFLSLINMVAEEVGYRGLITLHVGTASFKTNSEEYSEVVVQGYKAKNIVPMHENRLLINDRLTFDNFIEGKSNRLARAAAMMVAETYGTSYNPLLIYGGVGLGKTHLLHALSNVVLKNRSTAKIAFISAERFVGDMVNALRTHAMEKFKAFYRTADLLLVDDVQFLAGKEQSQEEFFHVFNTMVEGNNQIVLTCDRYPKDIKGLEDRLKSRFGWGLSVAIEPPDLETRVAIVMSKAGLVGVNLSEDVGFFIANRIHSNVRELEGALKLVLAYAKFTQAAISVDMAKEALKDILRSQQRFVGLDTIQRVVAEYYHIRLNELTSKSRKRNIARPRQIAMALAKELTTASYPEIGSAFGGRDHTTVLHACRRMEALRRTDAIIAQDHRSLLRILAT